MSRGQMFRGLGVSRPRSKVKRGKVEKVQGSRSKLKKVSGSNVSGSNVSGSQGLEAKVEKNAGRQEVRGQMFGSLEVSRPRLKKGPRSKGAKLKRSKVSRSKLKRSKVKVEKVQGQRSRGQMFRGLEVSRPTLKKGPRPRLKMFKVKGQG